MTAARRSFSGIAQRRATCAALITTLALLAGCAPRTQPATPEPVEPPARVTAAPAGATATPQPPIPTREPAPSPTLAPTATLIPLDDAPASVRYTLPLVTQHVTETTATLFFELERPAEGIVLAWPEGDPSRQWWAALAPGQARQQIRLNELEPGAAYRVMVALGPEPESGAYHPVAYRGEPWGLVSFRTASDREPLRVGVIGDGGFGDPVTYRLVEEMEYKAAHGIGTLTDEKYRLLFVGVPCYPIFRRFNEMFTQWGGTFINSTYLWFASGGTNRGFEYNLNDPLESLAEGILISVRDAMDSMFYQDQVLAGMVDEFEADGIIYHPIKSCRTVSTGLADNRRAVMASRDIPTLFIESDMMDRRVVSEAQLKNRIDAYFEGLAARRAAA